MAKTLTIREANRLAAGLAHVMVDPEDNRLWQVERPGSVQAYEPMTRKQWQTFLKRRRDLNRLLNLVKHHQADATAERQRDIAHLIEWLGQELRKCQKPANAEQRRDIDRLLKWLGKELAGPQGADNLVAEADACPKCRERNVDTLVWQENGKVKCTACGKQYTPTTR
jgi:hypothetical protein